MNNPEQDTNSDIGDALGQAFGEILEALGSMTKSSRVAQALSQSAPHCTILQLFFDDESIVDGQEVSGIEQLYVELGSSDAVFQAVLDLEGPPSSGPFSKPRFQFSLLSFQNYLKNLAGYSEAMLYNVSGRAVELSLLDDDELDEFVQRNAGDNTFCSDVADS